MNTIFLFEWTSKRPDEWFRISHNSQWMYKVYFEEKYFITSLDYKKYLTLDEAKATADRLFKRSHKVIDVTEKLLNLL